MTPDELQNNIDVLLIEMNDILEKGGYTIQARFEFLPEKSEYIAVCEKFGWIDNELQTILNVCITRSLLKSTMNSGEYLLTQEGQGRALSAKHGKSRHYELNNAMKIGTVNIQGSAQIGHGNIQNIQNIITELYQKIEAADVPEEQKTEAKNLFLAFLSHPLVVSIAGGISAGLTSGITTVR